MTAKSYFNHLISPLYNDYYGSFFCVVQGDFIILWDAFLATFFTVSIDSSLVLI